ncbi:endoplasmic reticulum metallopeptidase 1 [Eupeodes corollae]|uniref:endoplasmic reticulum metallopeptidase 1 n=1 Tax=Eupeodes corollae TaxID=290404 RepID=UPI00248F5E0E|nr:endoplasmic reticulum metallopeptidase 1 [Eupeodes corollae]
MTFSLKIQLDSVRPRKNAKFGWYWPPIICVAWFAIFYAAVIPSYFAYPKILLTKDEHRHPEEFIGERSELQLLALSNIGVKLAGTPEHEKAVEFLLQQIELVQKNARYDLYDIEVDVQASSGQFLLWKMVTIYHNVQNVIVKLSPKNTNSTSYLLVNSHFDSEVGSPAAGDAGVMITTMLETLRVISISEFPLKNPIVFLFNGAEENKLLGSHGFITQHKWAENVKAVINLDSAGSGGREVLFQSGPGHPWLTKYYGKYIPHPFASTMAEELFQNNFIPSDTDFRIFRDHKGVPGFDMAHSNNGYVYHTKFDRFNIIPQGTYQTTGENVLALTRALANAPELEDPSKHAAGHTVFYDYLGWFTVHYTEGAGVAINLVVSLVAFLSIGVSVWMMLKEKAYEPKDCLMRFVQIFGVQLLTVILGIGLTILVGMLVRALGLSMSWYKDSWMLFGIYFCPMFFVMGIIPAFYLGWTKKNTVITLRHSVFMFLHSQAIILSLITILMTSFSIRSAFLPMVGVFFYTSSVILSIIAYIICKWKPMWFPIHLICNIPSFWFYSYVTFTFCHVFVAMQGRDGPNSNPELFISGVVSVLALHIGGFVVPLFHYFRKPKLFFSSFLVITLIFFIFAFSPIGFPFEKDVSAKRFYVIHTNRVFRNYGGEVARNESGYYVQPVDPRDVNLDDSVFKGAMPLSYTQENCHNELYCGLPLSSTRWKDWNYYSRWVPSGRPKITETVNLKLKAKTFLTPTKVRFEFTLSGPDRTVVYIGPLEGVKVTDWSFNRTPLEDAKYKPPYFIYTTYSKELIPLNFWIELERSNELWEGPTFKLAVGGHLMHHEKHYTKEYKKYLASFPEWVYPTAWVASHESWQF